MATEISVVIPSYNSGNGVDRCLDALKAQDTDAGVELIVVDSSDDGTGDRLESRRDIKLVRSPERLYAGEARNIGGREASGTIVCFIDADCLPSPGWIQKIWEIRPDLKKLMVGGAILNGTPQSVVGTAEYFSEVSAFLPDSGKRYVRFLPGANFALGTEAFNQAGGFGQSAAGEDVSLGRKFGALGIRTFFDPDISVTHFNRTGLPGFLKNQFKLGRGAAENRLVYDLPGSGLARNPLLWPVVPAARFARITARSLLFGKGQRSGFLRSVPAVLSGSVFFGLGFWKGACAGLRSGQARAAPLLKRSRL